MIGELNHLSKTVGFKINKSKLKILANTDNNINNNLEHIADNKEEDYIFIGQLQL